jgi:creatinine amidohydrolase
MNQTNIMKILLILLFFTTYAVAQEIPARWDELTATDFPKALEKSSQTCILPIGILEKHGPHLPIGSDLIHVREWASRTVKKEYAVVFPDYFYGQINEAKQQPGAFALPSRVIWDLLDATIEEIARNGFKKIVIINGHGGNPEFIRFFIQSQLGKRHDYAVYFFEPVRDSMFNAKVTQMRKSDPSTDQHAGEKETSLNIYYRPDLVQMERASLESWTNQKRLPLPAYTAIWWYANFPNHYAGDGAKGTKELGQLFADFEIESLAKALKVIKADTKTLQLQKEYFDRIDQLNK